MSRWAPSFWGGLILTLTFKALEVAFAGGPIGVWSVVRWYLVIAVLFSPWLYFTLANRLKVKGDQIEWGIAPFTRRFALLDIILIEIAPNDDGPPRALVVHYLGDGERRKVLLVKGEYPDSEVRAFITGLKAQRPDLNIPELL